ncbi:MAG: hypothetical protein H7A37_07750 [Chlamydiales bacterium]|nr:hypothetical protein [Chlamydiales bacterium]
MHARTKKNAVYSNLDKKPFRINRDQFSKIKMQDIVVDKVMGSGEMLASLDKIFSVVNMTDPNQPGYFSYDILGQQRTEGSNKEKN